MERCGLPNKDVTECHEQIISEKKILIAHVAKHRNCAR